MVNHRKSFVRIIRGITMSWEMLCHSHDSSFFQSAGIGNTFISNSCRIFPKRPNPNHGIIDVTIHIQIWSKINMNTHFLTLPGNFLAILTNKQVIFDGSQHHILRETGCSAQTHRQAPLTIQRNQQRNFRGLLHPVRQLSLHFRTSFME